MTTGRVKVWCAANPGANIFFAAGPTSETGTFSKPSTWQSTSGTVRFGVPEVP